MFGPLQDCTVAIAPIHDEACSEPSAGSYSYRDLQLNAYYASLTTIHTTLPWSEFQAVE